MRPAGDGQLRVLYVCTANICRSPSAAQLLRAQVGSHPQLAGIEVASAGTRAMPGSPGCSLAPALQPDHWRGHAARRLSAGEVEWADVILVAAREHSATVAGLDLRARSRTFTIVQAGRIADWMAQPGGVIEAGRLRAELRLDDSLWAARFPAGDPQAGIVAMPEVVADRWAWFVNEMDAARGLAGAPPPAPEPARERSLRGLLRRRERAVEGGWDAQSQDLADPHQVETVRHEQVGGAIAAATDALVGALLAVAG